MTKNEQKTANLTLKFCITVAIIAVVSFVVVMGKK